MGFLDRVGMRWLLLFVALVPMAIASVAAIRLSSSAAADERAARADLEALERLIALGDYRASVINETASYRGWATSIAASDIDKTAPQMVMARAGLSRLASSGADTVRATIDGAPLSEAESGLVAEVDALLERVRSDFSDDAGTDLLPTLASIDDLIGEIESATSRLVDRRSDDWVVVDLRAEMLSRLSNEVFIVGTMLISGQSDADARQQGALLVSQTDETFERLLAAVDDDERVQLLEAFENDYTRDLRATVASLPDRFEPLSLATIAGAPADLARFGSAADLVRAERAEAIRSEAIARADDASSERILMLVVAVAAILIPALLLAVIARRVNRRLQILTDAARRLSEGELGVRAEGVGGSDELALLAATFNDVSATVSLGRDQISALADGRLDDPVLQQQMPGAVGDDLRAALRQLGDTTAELAHHARHDRLTGLLDRHGFHLAEPDLETDVDWAVLLIDLDGFKAVNDGFGHATGDDVLIIVGERLSAALRSGDVAARLGGDEFAAFVPREDVEQIADRLISSLSAPIHAGGHEHLIGASIGWTPLAPDDGLDAALGRADQAMYAAKGDEHHRIRSVPYPVEEPANDGLRALRSLR